MTFAGWGMILLYTVLFVALAKPMGGLLYALYRGETMPLARALGPVERGFYRLAGVEDRKSVV